jgi:hypothetical protein
MVSRIHLTLLIGIAAGIWATLLYFSGISVPLDYIRPLPTVIGILTILFLIFDRWLWKLSFFYPWFVSMPNLSGAWKGQIISTWIDKKTGQQISPIDAVLIIYQTYSSLNLRMITKESKSDLLSGNFIQNNVGPQKIAGIYNNIPNILVRERSPIHYGGLLLEIHKGKNTILEGEYWTDRDTKGVLKFEKHLEKKFDSFDSACAAFQKRCN